MIDMNDFDRNGFDMDKFDKAFDRTSNTVNIAFRVILTVIVLFVVAVVVVGILVLLHFGII